METLASRTLRLTRDMNCRRSDEQVLEVFELTWNKDGKLTLADEEFELQALLEQVSGLISASAEIKGLKFGIDVEPSLRKAFRGDPL